jgi:hypothetical protein
MPRAAGDDGEDPHAGAPVVRWGGGAGMLRPLPTVDWGRVARS